MIRKNKQLINLIKGKESDNIFKIEFQVYYRNLISLTI